MIRAILAAVVVVAAAAIVGCDAGDTGTNAAAAKPTTNAATQPAVPQVGREAMTKAQYQPTVGRYGGRIVRDALGEPKSFNPITAAETSTTDYTARMFEGLTREDPFTGDIIPLIAERWETSADGLTWTFYLRRDVHFNDGSPLTARDVEFTWNALVYDLSRPDPQTSTPRWPCSLRDIATFDGKIVKVQAIDDYTVSFTTPVKVAIWDRYAGAEVLSQRKYAPLVPTGAFGGAIGTDSRPEDIVGSGPFILGEYKRGESVTLKRNPNYWKKDAAGNQLPYLDELVTLVARDLNIMLLNFQQGVTDVFGLRGGKDVATLRPEQEKGNFTIWQFGPTYGTEFISFNMNVDAGKEGKLPEYKVNWFRDRRFRQAVSHAIDRPAIVRAVLRNLGYPLSVPYTLAPGPYRQTGFEPYEYSPEKAKALLAEMGLIDRNGDGILEDAQGNKVQFTVNTNSGNTQREEQANMIRTDLSKIGMDVNVLFLEFNLLVDKIDNNHDWEAIVMGFTGGPEPHDGANFWYSSAHLHMWWPNQKTPGFDWEKRIDEIFSQGIQELDKEKRKQLYREWIDIVHREQPVVYLTAPERVAALRNRFGNVFPAPLGGFFHNEEEIFVLDAGK
jgi:peptide/nickel transport system substrate-binding protein